eukprot:CAMPEP_0184324912 /NCGR_PEP_ID=MMETSP1049-20130417/137533_1 /TAXON_ID=77928 /ORGANISM="Proteomonas sulcata, Strain CCMP704" /LENGTH=42 /DNA_ID= /DNA_START= /DNA_END= /DNA_ORIENTATION=
MVAYRKRDVVAIAWCEDGALDSDLKRQDTCLGDTEDSRFKLE